MQNYKLCMRYIVLEGNSNSLRYWIYTLIISTYRMNKRGFDCARSCTNSRCLFAESGLPLAPFSLFLISILPRLLTPFSFFFAVLYPIRSRTTYLSHSSRLPLSLLHHGIQLKIIPPTVILFYLTSSHSQKFTLQFTSSYVKHMLHAARKHASHFSVGPW